MVLATAYMFERLPQSRMVTRCLSAKAATSYNIFSVSACCPMNTSKPVGKGSLKGIKLKSVSILILYRIFVLCQEAIEHLYYFIACFVWLGRGGVCEPHHEKLIRLVIILHEKRDILQVDA